MLFITILPGSRRIVSTAAGIEIEAEEQKLVSDNIVTMKFFITIHFHYDICFERNMTITILPSNYPVILSIL